MPVTIKQNRYTFFYKFIVSDVLARSLRVVLTHLGVPASGL